MTGAADDPTGQRAGAGLRARPRLVALAAGAALVVAAWGAGLAWFVAQIPVRVDDPATRTDAIVVLTGGAQRLSTGLELLAQGRADRLFVSGVHRDVDVEELLRVSQKTRDEFACCIDLGHEARDTIGNARETARWMAERGSRSLRLVTSYYHLPRSLLEFRRAMPHVEVVAHPVFAPELARGPWWWRPKSASLIVVEYNKYLLARVRHGALAALGRDP